MKKSKLFWTPFALKCLDAIKEYIENTSQSETVAKKYVQKIIKRVDQLEDLPESGQIEPLLKHLKQNSRYLVEGNYKIIYQFKDFKVIVTDVFHVKQNPWKILKRNKH